MMKDNNKNKFNTPEGYFDNFLDNLNARILKEESLIPKSDGFNVPDEYFNRVQYNLPNKTPKVIQLVPQKMYYAAASIAAILLLAIVFPWKSNSAIVDFEDLSSSEISSYIQEVGMKLSSYEIAEALNFNEIQFDEILENQIEDDEIIEYLDETIDHIDELSIDYATFD